MLGMKVQPEAYMSLRERFDFLITILVFACLNAKWVTFWDTNWILEAHFFLS